MEIGFDNILEHVVPMDDFSMKLRFTDENYNQLSQLHLDQLKPLDREASRFLWDYISATNLHNVSLLKEIFLKALIR